MSAIQAELSGYPLPPIVEKICMRAEELEASMDLIRCHLNRAVRFIAVKNIDAAQNEIIDALFIVEARE